MANLTCTAYVQFDLLCYVVMIDMLAAYNLLLLIHDMQKSSGAYLYIIFTMCAMLPPVHNTLVLLVPGLTTI